MNMHGTENPSTWVQRWAHLIAPGGTVLGQGDSFAAGGKGFQISYRGSVAAGVFDAGAGNDNDVVLKVLKSGDHVVCGENL